MEQILKAAGIKKAELAKMIAELIKHDPDVRGAVMQIAYNTPGIMVVYRLPRGTLSFPTRSSRDHDDTGSCIVP